MLVLAYDTASPLTSAYAVLVPQLGVLYLVVQHSELSILADPGSTTLEAPRIRVVIREQLLNLGVILGTGLFKAVVLLLLVFI